MYALLLLLFSPLIVLITLRDARRRQGGCRFLKERLGFAYQAPIAMPLWLHAASVGEVKAVLPLLIAIKQEHPSLPLLITTATAGGARALQPYHNLSQHAYLPLDYTSAVKRFLAHYRPCCGLIVETELWPNLYRQCQHASIPLFIINGRLSLKTLATKHWLKSIYRQCLHQLTYIYARSLEDQQNFLALGAAEDKISIVGNLKFTTSPEVFAKPNPLPREYVLAVSTHADEEQQLYRIWQTLPHANLLLVIAPRHVERGLVLAQQLRKMGCRLVQRSREEYPQADTEVYLLDTLGELADFYPAARFVIMGGSFIPHGGQNILEPAAHGKAIITGPHMHNFADELRLLMRHQAILQADSYPALAKFVSQLLQRPRHCTTLGEAAATVIKQQAAILNAYTDIVNKIIRDHHKNSAAINDGQSR